jgi:mycothiol synthase
LWLLRRDGAGFRPAPGEPARTWAFNPDRDARLWVEINARAFADHPEQGRIDRAGLAQRLAEPWFTPGDIVFAGRGPSSSAGYVWVKIDPPGSQVGEIYALGVCPDAQGQGLGRVLLDAGLRRLAARGARSVVLYVDVDNAPALALYRAAGFARIAVHGVYALPI